MDEVNKNELDIRRLKHNEVNFKVYLKVILIT